MLKELVQVFTVLLSGVGNRVVVTGKELCISHLVRLSVPLIF
jgi:hypothetical protein